MTSERRSPTQAKRSTAKKNTADSAIDTSVVRDLADLLAGTDLTEIEIEKGDLRIRVARMGTAPIYAPPPVSVSVATPPATIVNAAPAVEAISPEDHPGAVTSPMVGTAYRRPNPESKAFVEIGSTVAVGDRVMLVEAMKTFNEIVAPHAGTVTAIFVEDGQPVEYGQALLVVE
jgi:acetyl-CoA carboxylase biotin carboxyl carrier protein